ncbi:MAG: PIN domain-containing protein [Halobacteriales archaeon]|nr:PIN domain-containing protein [Halobacteriales archaeon]
MKTVFVDANVLVSGIFFDGPEAKLLDMRRMRLITAEVCEDELAEVAVRKADAFGVSKEGAREMLEGALVDIDVVPEGKCDGRYGEAAEVVGEGNDAEVLACVLSVEPDYFVTGDEDFHVEGVREMVNVVETTDVLGSV